MLNVIKKFQTTINQQFQMVILAVLSMIGLYVYVSGASGFLDVLIALLPIALILVAVWLLYLDKKVLEAYIVIFMIIFANGLTNFIGWIFSYHFFFEDFQITFSINTILLLIGCLYLGVMIVSYLINDGFKISFKKLDYVLLVLLFALYLYLANGIVNLLVNGFLIFLAINASNKFAAFALMLRLVIATPFVIIERFIDETAKFTTIHDWVIELFEIALIVLIVLSVIPLLTKKKIEKTE